MSKLKIRVIELLGALGFLLFLLILGISLFQFASTWYAETGADDSGVMGQDEPEPTQGLNSTVDTTTTSVETDSDLTDTIKKTIAGEVGVDFGNGTTQTHEWNASEGITAYTVFSSFWTLHVRTFALLGVYVEGVEDVYEGNGSYWFFLIESEENSLDYANVGVSSYSLEQGDYILLRFE